MAVLVAAGGTGFVLRAQTPPPRLAPPRVGYVYPAGGRVGTTFTVTVGGQFLGDVSAADFFGGGVTARVVHTQRPLTQKELEALKEEGEALREKGRAARKCGVDAAGATIVWTPADEKRADELRALAGYRMNRQTAPAICEAATLDVTIAPDAAPGAHELRLRGPNGWSNPLVFEVGALAEFAEPAAFPNTAAPDPAAAGGDGTRRTPPPPRNPERALTLPAVANGQVLPGEVDRWRFQARRGQKLVIAVRARALVPYLADAVPGWFQATVALLDAQGRELAYDDDFRFSPDPVLFHEVRADGEYVLAIKDAIYRGRQDFVYRVAIGELPFVTSVFPLGGAKGAGGDVAVRGWNLPAARARAADAVARGDDTATLVVGEGAARSNDVVFALGEDPEIAETGDNDAADRAQPVTLPVVANGRIERGGDEDWYAVVGRGGAQIAAEVFARRLNSPLDSLLVATDTSGRELGRNDDHEDKGAGLTTHHADSVLRFVLPADGRARVRVSDAQRQGGAEYAYRLALHEARPDFALRVVPATINVRPGQHVAVTVYAMRREGFSGPIELGVRGGDGVFRLAGARIPAGQDKVRLTLTTAAPPRDALVPLAFFGRARIGGAATEHRAVPCEDQMQAFAYRHLVPTQELAVAVIGRGAGGGSAPMRVVDAAELQLVPGRETRATVVVSAGRFFENLKLELSEPPDGVTLEGVAWRADTVELRFHVDAAKAVIGSRGNLLVQLSGERAGAAEKRGAGDEKAKRAARGRIPLTLLPALPFEIVAPTAAEAR